MRIYRREDLPLQAQRAARLALHFLNIRVNARWYWTGTLTARSGLPRDNGRTDSVELLRGVEDEVGVAKRLARKQDDVGLVLLQLRGSARRQEQGARSPRIACRR